MVYYGITKNQSEKLYLQIISCAEEVLYGTPCQHDIVNIN